MQEDLDCMDRRSYYLKNTYIIYLQTCNLRYGYGDVYWYWYQYQARYTSRYHRYRYRVRYGYLVPGTYGYL